MREVRGIQYLRGLAATFVVVHHAMLATPKPFFTIGAAGVDLFFIISGYIMWATTRHRTVSPITFLRKRVVRVVPLYRLATIVTVTIHFFDSGIVFMWDTSLSSFVRSMLFYPHAYGEIFSTSLIQGWTLCFEMLFYLVFAFCLFVRVPVLRLIALVFAFSVILLGRIWWKSPFTSLIIIEFLFGIAVAEITDRVRITRLASMGVIAFGILVLAVVDAGNLHRAFAWGVPAAILVLGMVWLERAGGLPQVGFLHRLGDASYSIYLWHLLLFGCFVRLMGGDIAHVSLLTAYFQVAIALLAGLVLHAIVEKPLMKKLDFARASFTFRTAKYVPPPRKPRFSRSRMILNPGRKPGIGSTAIWAAQ